MAVVLTNEHAPELCFAGTWSDEGLALAARHGFSRSDLDATFLVASGERALTREMKGRPKGSQPASMAGASATAR